MKLEKRFQEKYGRISYKKNFCNDFREAIKGIDIIVKTISNSVNKEGRENKCRNEKKS